MVQSILAFLLPNESIGQSAFMLAQKVGGPMSSFQCLCISSLAVLQAKLADFGLVREMTDTVGATTNLVGTPGYMDPAYLASKRPTPAVDVYRRVRERVRVAGKGCHHSVGVADRRKDRRRMSAERVLACGCGPRRGIMDG